MLNFLYIVITLKKKKLLPNLNCKLRWFPTWRWLLKVRLASVRDFALKLVSPLNRLWRSRLIKATRWLTLSSPPCPAPLEWISTQGGWSTTLRWKPQMGNIPNHSRSSRWHRSTRSSPCWNVILWKIVNLPSEIIILRCKYSFWLIYRQLSERLHHVHINFLLLFLSNYLKIMIKNWSEHGEDSGV